ncbi:HAMP domain-containing histidine kinase [Nocardioides anomalus]|uniref:Signal transduction histidine-protein kinase/phosphatase MprB n=1 Tax=Nocardioides anomalus TaxID=2712223 RepID=A0A6G6WEF3_9ACTN|nr:HAMP domain-containing sensor histidine kinase [Nocardioides anomalus]QIG43708.1 HAMP domain-containing histidine kinase [Nocardioides anomalus]
MRRSLISVVAAVVAMVLLAMLVPMALLLRGYALEDRISRAALEVQATETVVSGAGDDRGAVAAYLDRINRDTGTETTVLFPGDDADTDIGPDPGEDHRVVDARTTGRARLDDVAGGAEFLVPVSLGGSTAGADATPVIRVVVHEPGWTESGILRSWLVLALLGLVLLAGALALADRLGRSFVQPIRALAAYAGALGHRPVEPVASRGPREVRELSAALTRLVGRIETLLERERAGVADLSHRLRTPITTLRLRVEALSAGPERDRLGADLDELEALVDHVVREARRSEREGLVAAADGVAVLSERVRFWEPLAEEQDRSFAFTSTASAPVAVRASAADLEAVVDALLDNVFTHAPEGSAVAVSLAPSAAGGLVLTVDDGGPGLPAGLDVVRRGTSGAGSTGLGLAIADQTATASGGGLALDASPLGGARVVVTLGPA